MSQTTVNLGEGKSKYDCKDCGEQRSDQQIQRKGCLEESMSGGEMKVLVFTEMSVLTSLMLANLAVTCIWK